MLQEYLQIDGAVPYYNVLACPSSYEICKLLRSSWRRSNSTYLQNSSEWDIQISPSFLFYCPFLLDSSLIFVWHVYIVFPLKIPASSKSCNKVHMVEIEVESQGESHVSSWLFWLVFFIHKAWLFEEFYAKNILAEAEKETQLYYHGEEDVLLLLPLRHHENQIFLFHILPSLSRRIRSLSLRRESLSAYGEISRKIMRSSYASLNLGWSILWESK